MRRFDDNTYYRPTDEAMRLIATVGTLAQWRHYAKGPPFTKIGRRILYLGRDLNRWIDEQRVEPKVSGTGRVHMDGTSECSEAKSRRIG